MITRDNITSRLSPIVCILLMSIVIYNRVITPHQNQGPCGVSTGKSSCFTNLSLQLFIQNYILYNTSFFIMITYQKLTFHTEIMHSLLG